MCIVVARKCVTGIVMLMFPRTATSVQRLRNQRVTLLKGRCLAFSQFKNILFQPPALRYDQFLRYQTRPALRFISLGNYKCLVKVN